ncbi:Uncharacterised protein [Mycobacteroides abscessus subsp. abscessus]|nr:Uncharacterised protein [Mycobacteroides abscessus subsp. abscessus]
MSSRYSKPLSAGNAPRHTESIGYPVCTYPSASGLCRPRSTSSTAAVISGVLSSPRTARQANTSNCVAAQITTRPSSRARSRTTADSSSCDTRARKVPRSLRSWASGTRSAASVMAASTVAGTRDVRR